MEGLIGKKIGMTQVYDADGVRTCVTVIEVGPCPVVQVKTPEKDGYSAVQIGYGEQKVSRLTKAVAGHLKKTGGLEGGVRVLKEFALDEGETVEVGKAVTVANFEGVKYVDVTGVTKGKGFAGVLKRYGFAGGNMTHGGHSKRRTGGLGGARPPRLDREGQEDARPHGRGQPQGDEPRGRRRPSRGQRASRQGFDPGRAQRHRDRAQVPQEQREEGGVSSHAED